MTGKTQDTDDELGQPTGEPDTDGPDLDVVDDNPPPVKTDRVEED